MKLKLRLGLLFLTVIGGLSVNAQYNILHDKTGGCAPLEVKFSIDVPAGSNTYWYFENNFVRDTAYTYTFKTAGSRRVRLYYYDTLNVYQGRDDVDIDVTGASEGIITSENTVCTGTNIDFSLDYTPNSCTWHFGDGTTTTGNEATHSYASIGDYDVMAIVQTACGTDTSRGTISVVSDLPVTGSYSIHNPTPQVCPGSSVYIQGNGYPNTGIITGYQIDFGDGTIENVRYTNHTYASAGIYPVKVTFTNSCGNDTTLVDTVEITTGLPFQDNISYYISSTGVCPNQPISFNLYSSNFPSFLWDFGDGTTSTERYNSHAYTSTGTYPVSLTVTDNCGNDSIIKDTIEVGTNFPFQENISYNISSGGACPNQPIYLNLYSSNFPSFSWDFGDGTTSTNRYNTHRYDEIGTYPVSLTVTDHCGNDSIIRDTIEISTDYPFPSTNISRNISPKVVCPGQSVSFQMYSDYSSYNWNFGDGQTSTNRYNSHSYSEFGKYAVSCTVTDFCGNDSTITDTIEVTPDAPWSRSMYMTYPTKIICPGAQVRFRAQYGYSEYHWDFGNGTTSTGSRYGYGTFEELGDYKVTLRVVNECGKDSILTDSIFVVDTLTLNNVAEPDIKQTILLSDQARFRNRADLTNISTVEWQFGDGISQESKNTYVYYRYGKPGNYIVKAKYISYCGSVKEFSDTVTVDPVTQITGKSISMSKNPVCLDDVVSFTVSTNNIKNYIWEVDNGYKSYNPNFKYSFDKTGEYDIQLQLFDYYGNDTIISSTITVVESIALPDISLSFGQFEYNTGDQINLRLNDTYGTVRWDLGDGNISTANSLQYRYQSKGEYNASVAVTNACGTDGDTKDFTFTIQDEVPTPPADPEIEITQNSHVCPGQNFSLSCGTNFSVESFTWDLGDGTVITNSNSYIYHTYSSEGTYDVSVTVVDDCRGELTATGKVKVGGLTYTPNFGLTPLVCTGANVGASAYNSNRFTTFLWDLGDGTEVDTYSFNHTYSEPGSYKVTLTSTDICGNTSSTSRNILVKDTIPIGQPGISVTTNGCEGQSIPLNSGGNHTVQWDLGDGMTKQGNYISHTFDTEGIYKVTALLENNCGGGDTLTYVRSIEIDNNGGPGKSSPNNTVSIPGNVCLGDVASLRSYAHVSGTTELDLGDGTTKTLTLPAYSNQYYRHTYSGLGLYNITHSTTLDCGAPISGVKSLQVIDCTVEEEEEEQGPKDNPNSVLNLHNSGGKGICVNSDVVLSAEGGVSHIWNFGDGSPEEEHEGGRSQVVHKYAAEGKYKVTVAINRICGDDEVLSRDIRIKCNYDYTSTENSNIDKALSLYPNPANDVLNVKIGNKLVANASLKVLNPVGQVVLEQQVTDEKMSIDISKLSAGIYFVKYMEGDDRTFIERFVRQ